MNIKTRPLMIGAGAGAALLVIISLIVQAGTYFTVTSMVDIINNPEAGLGGLGVTGLMSCISLICPVIIVMAAGYIYGHLANQEGPMETQDAAIGGAATGAVAGIIYGVVNAIVGLLVTQFFLADSLNELNQLAGSSGNPFGSALGAGSGIVGILVGSCCWLVAGGVLGAVGGIIANAVAGRGK
ncbi:MAG: hypothetical protein KDE04_16545 [Anaerolineales bacterium]|nr:hypothetical protein [Anaerolineales bacterium]